jgi:hypothetical protein
MIEEKTNTKTIKESTLGNFITRLIRLPHNTS